jgi:hypothetical protein
MGTAGVVDTGRKYAIGINNIGGKSPPVSTPLAVN